jgi:hypothetical protein
MKRCLDFFKVSWRLLGIISLLMGGVLSVHAAFEENARGARGVAMGDAYGAVADTADGLYWNPASLVRVPMQEILGTHADLFTGIQGVDLMTDSLSYAHPTLRQGVWGASWNSLSSKSLYGEDTLTLGYARRMNVEIPFLKGSDLSLGGNLKYMRTRYTLDEATAQDPVFSNGRNTDAFTGDIGTLLQNGPITAGLAFQNLNEPNFGLQERDRVPFTTRLSAAYAGRLWFLEKTTIALDLVFVRNATRLNAGWENLFFNDQAAFRLGLNPDEFTTGLGWRYVAARPRLDLGLDYAYVLPLSMAENQSVTHRFSLDLRFGR